MQRKKAGKRRQEQLPLETQIKSGQWISLIFKSPLYTGRNLNIQNRGGSRTDAASKMERFVIIVNGWEPLTIITKHTIFDVAAVLDPSLQKTSRRSYKCLMPVQFASFVRGVVYIILKCIYISVTETVTYREFSHVKIDFNLTKCTGSQVFRKNLYERSMTL